MKSDREIKRDTRGEFDNSFDVPLPPAEAWPVLSDIRRIAPCMPGVELTEVVDETTYQGRFSVPLGPVALAFAGTVKLEEIDPVNHTARIKAQGRDGEEFMALAPQVPVRTTTMPFPLAQANEALAALREGRIEGAAVLVP